MPRLPSLKVAALGASFVYSSMSCNTASCAVAYATFYVSALSPFGSGSGRGSRSRSVPLSMVPPPSSPRGDPEGEGTHSYVEGLNFGSKEEEILAKGGDPFFLEDDDDEDNDEWYRNDNVKEEGFNDKEGAMPSVAFMSNMASLPGTIDVVGRGSDSSTDGSGSSRQEEEHSTGALSGASSIPFDPAVGAGGLHSRPEGEGFDEQRAALLDIGGDPFFMQDGDEGADVDDVSDDKFAPIDEENSWDGWEIEDAHYD
mmetsp:Transcript_25611/g.56043  ORF Transcript_25611/g.56043 Transcript_25611/m.56043 type:complete len:256 (+) Transcript_25611:91-858(+)